MRRLLLIALAVSLLVGASAGVASARLAGVPDPAPDPAPFTAVAAAPPAPDAAQPGSYAFVSTDVIGARIAQSAGSGSSPAASTSAGASTSVTISAIVLPVAILVIDEAGDVSEVVTNTPERDGRHIVYLVRLGTADGAHGELTTAIWSQGRAALGAAIAGTGSVWSS